jgi:hypothetical protein
LADQPNIFLLQLIDDLLWHTFGPKTLKGAWHRLRFAGRTKELEEIYKQRYLLPYEDLYVCKNPYETPPTEPFLVNVSDSKTSSHEEFDQWFKEYWLMVRETSTIKSLLGGRTLSYSTKLPEPDADEPLIAEGDYERLLEGTSAAISLVALARERIAKDLEQIERLKMETRAKLMLLRAA